MRALTLLALLFSAPAVAKKPKGDEPTKSFTRDGDASVFADVVAAAAQGNRVEAGNQLAKIVNDPSKAKHHGQAWLMLADNFASFDLDLAAVAAFGKAIELAPEQAAPRVAEALDLAEQTGELAPVAGALGANLGISVDDTVRNRVAYVTARHHVRNGDLGPAAAILMTGRPQQPGFEDIELLRGVVLSLQGRNDDAVAPFLTAEAAARRASRDERFINRANLNIARAYYATGNYTQAILYYAKVERSSDFWLDAQFERAWAHFRGEDVNGALAMLFTHASPFFEEGYYNPEADLLRAYGLFIMCKFPDASKQIDAFEAKWKPIAEAYSGVTMSPEEAFADVAAYLSGGSHQLPVAMLRQYQGEDRMQDAVRAAALAEKEIATAEGLGEDVGALAAGVLRDLHDERVKAEGQRVLDKVAASAKELESFLTDIEITRLDLLNLEAQMYERAAATGELEQGDAVERLRDFKKTRKGYRVWPFQGEFWADELGWYVFSARPDCPNSMTAERRER